jgi:hypothetical protein
MTIDVNWKFIGTLEGAHVLKGYVPKSKDSNNSGVTVATGVDLGQMAHSDLADLPPSLSQRLVPYAGLRGKAARDALETSQLTITDLEADLLDQHARRNTIYDLCLHYRLAAGIDLEGLPEPCQTVLASVTFQYGSPWARCPSFWKFATGRQWRDVYNELMDFGDAYAERRRKEAAYLKSGLGM